MQQVGRLTRADVEATLNQGVGMAVVLPPDSVAAAQASLDDSGLRSWVCGHVGARHEQHVELVGDHAS